MVNLFEMHTSTFSIYYKLACNLVCHSSLVFDNNFKIFKINNHSKISVHQKIYIKH